MSPITDGTVIWRMRDSRCRYTVGELVAKVGPLNDYDHLLLCDGSTISATDYPDLVAALGGTQLPNLIGRVLQGNSVGGNYQNAGLPNVTGQLFDNVLYGNQDVPILYGSFYSHSQWHGLVKQYIDATAAPASALTVSAVSLDASRVSSIYGASTTVQPPAYTTRIYICYAG